MRRYLPNLAPEHVRAWMRRVEEDPKLVEFALEEAASRRERVNNLAGYANAVYVQRRRAREIA